MNSARSTIQPLVLLATCCCIGMQVTSTLAQVEQSRPTTSAPVATQSTQPESQPYEPNDYDDDDSDIDLLELDIPVVVTAGRREQKITAIPHAVSVITAEDIRLSGAQSIPDALRLIPGVDVAELSSGASAVSPRGFQGFLDEFVLILVDGRQIFDSLFGGTAWGAWPFQLEDIERIEVIRGPGGVVWGANAVAGVINIITKDPADQVGVTITASGGSRGTFKQHTGYAFADDKLRFRISGEYEATDGFQKGGSAILPLDDKCRRGRLGVYAIYEADPKNTLVFSGGSAFNCDGMPPSLIGGLDPERVRSRTEFLLGKWIRNENEDNRLEITGYVNDFSLDTHMPGIRYRYQQLALQVGHTFSPAAGHTLSWGIDSRTDLLDATSSGTNLIRGDYVSSAIIGLYLQDEWRFARRWTLNLGGRIDYEFYGGFEPSGRAALSYALDDNSQIYGAISRAFQMPAVGARFLNAPVLGGLAYITGSQDTDAQDLVAYEVGYRARFFDRFETNVNLFWHEFDNVVTLTDNLGPPGLINGSHYNRAAASIYGAELELKYNVTDRLILLGHYSYEELDWRSAVSLGDKDGMSPPRHKFMLGARYNPLEDLHLSTQLHFTDEVTAPDKLIPMFRQRVPAYFRLDLRAEYEFWEDRASVAVGIQNLLDPHHLEGTTSFQNEAEVPRMIYAQLRINFK